jgi:hypothetical protein
MTILVIFQLLANQNDSIQMIRLLNFTPYKLHKLNLTILKSPLVAMNQIFSSLQSQNKEYGRVYEKSVRRLESLEVEHKRACDEIERLRRDLQVSISSTLISIDTSKKSDRFVKQSDIKIFIKWSSVFYVVAITYLFYKTDFIEREITAWAGTDPVPSTKFDGRKPERRSATNDGITGTDPGPSDRYRT